MRVYNIIYYARETGNERLGREWEGFLRGKNYYDAKCFRGNGGRHHRMPWQRSCLAVVWSRTGTKSRASQVTALRFSYVIFYSILFLFFAIILWTGYTVRYVCDYLASLLPDGETIVLRRVKKKKKNLEDLKSGPHHAIRSVSIIAVSGVYQDIREDRKEERRVLHVSQERLSGGHSLVAYFCVHCFRPIPNRAQRSPTL